MKKLLVISIMLFISVSTHAMKRTYPFHNPTNSLPFIHNNGAFKPVQKTRESNLTPILAKDTQILSIFPTVYESKKSSSSTLITLNNSARIQKLSNNAITITNKSIPTIIITPAPITTENRYPRLETTILLRVNRKK